MSLAWSEFLRGQIERPLTQRALWFAVFSVVLLLPLSFLWSSLAALRAHRRKKLSGHVPHEPLVVSIGNVAVGGTGKSPVVRAVARLALQAGYDVALFTRGFGQKNREPVLLQVDAASGSLPLSTWEKLSDETLEHLLQLRVDLPKESQLWIAQGSDRAELFQSLLHARNSNHLPSLSEKKQPLIVLVDDGLQQTAIPVHCDVVLWDPDSLTRAPRFALPFGPYRAGWPFSRPWAKSLPRADVVVWSRMLSSARRAEFDVRVKQARKELFESLSVVPQNSSMASPQSLQCMAVERTWLARAVFRETAPGFVLETFDVQRAPVEVTLLCGIARPERFEKSFRDLLTQVHLKPEIREFWRLADHGALNLPNGASSDAHRAIVTTLKDACRWWRTAEFKEWMRKRQLFVLCLETDLISAEAGWSEIELKSFFPVLENR